MKIKPTNVDVFFSLNVVIYQEYVLIPFVPKSCRDLSLKKHMLEIIKLTRMQVVEELNYSNQSKG